MDLPFIDAVVSLMAANGVRVGLKEGFGKEAVRLLRRFVPAFFSFSFYGVLAKPIADTVGLQSGASRFWAFVLILIFVVVAVSKVKGAVVTAVESMGATLPKWSGGVAGLLRSLGTSSLVLFPLAMAPWEKVQESVGDYSYFAGFLQKLFG